MGGASGTEGRFWTLDPIDGTKGFLRGDQYAIALALVEDGEVVLGALGCPEPAESPMGRAARCTWPTPPVRSPGSAPLTVSAPVSVATPSTLAEARFCESVESGHSNHGHSAQIAERLGIVGRALPDRQPVQVRRGRPGRCVDLSSPTHPRRLSREDLGPRGRQVRRGARRWARHRCHRCAARLLARSQARAQQRRGRHRRPLPRRRHRRRPGRDLDRLTTPPPSRERAIAAAHTAISP